MAFELIKTSLAKIIHPADTVFEPLIVVILLCSILIKCYMYLYNRSISRKIKSEAMMATAADSLSDTLATTVVLATTLTAHFTNLHLDGICGVLVGIFILYTGLTSARDTLNPLLGQAPDPAFVKDIETLVMSYDNILGIHDLLVHNYGPGRLMISLHAEVPADGNILELHDTIDNIERALQEQLKCDAVIHMDPVCTNDPEVTALKETVRGFLAELDSSLSLHDFRIVKGPTHTNIIFDLLLPYNFKLSDEEVKDIVTAKIKSLNPAYFTVIHIDKNFT